MRGWQGKHSGHALFLWKQGFISPVDQAIDAECKISNEARNAKRLPLNEDLSISYSDCDECGATFPFHLNLEFTGNIWTSFAESDSVKHADDIEDRWLQCPVCMNAFELSYQRFMITCPDCNILLMRAPS